ncbi:putative ATP-dependent helicase C23E6.02 [Mycena sanguinolenta]|uniref:Putative ATP-dependent helicase C23E6.02 n=1 Tax=Mycena sanguinolenta TaxID=230812 RepID=A0A8H6XZP5_9AGAR|nr:putative ATP-dependent helicase C23E6.02 [Mycena sanguinolenta]
MAMTAEALIALAKIQFPPTHAVPPSYSAELRKHIDLYPHDTHFLITPEPKTGYGKALCLEDGCDRACIPLVRRMNVKDGGVLDGVGSLAAYRAHIENHPTHKKNRMLRIKSGRVVPVASAGPSAGPSRVTVKQEGSSVLDALNAGSPLGTPQRRLGSSPHALSSSPAAPNSSSKPLVKRSSLVRVTPRANTKAEPVESPIPRAHVKAEPVETTVLRPFVKPEPAQSVIPRKRVSDTPFEDNVIKKAKQELETPKVPLARVNINQNTIAAKASQATLPVAGNQNTNAVAEPIDVETIRAKIASTQTAISHTQSLYDRMQRKKKKSKTDITRMSNHATELQRLKKLKAELDASLPRAPTSPVKRTASNVFGFGATLNPAPPVFYNPALAAAQQAKPKIELQSNPFAFGFGGPAVAPPPDLKPDLKPHVNAVASSSKLPQTALSDDEMDVDPVITLNKYMDGVPNIAAIGDSRDENGDFHGRGRDLYRGPQAKADDIDKFLIEAGNAELFDGNVTIDKALEKLGLPSTHDLLPSLDIPLMPHQLLGVAWMVDNEQVKSIKGGCLADEMGLGKTVQMIACMCKNPSDKPGCKTTLIISPLALLTQWNQEISTKTSADWKVLIYHGPFFSSVVTPHSIQFSAGSNKPKKKSGSPPTVALEWPDFEAEAKKKEKAKRKKPADDFIASDSDDSGSDRPKNKNKKKSRGLLFEVDFYRIVLDEAQNIRNKRTRVSRAVSELQATYRWCLTATPIVNTLSDVYGYLRFLKIRPWYDWSEFNGHIGKYEKKQPQLAVTRLQTILNLFLMRRMKTTLLDGKRLIELPEKTVELVSLEFSPEERDIYNQVETAQQAKFNKYLREGSGMSINIFTNQPLTFIQSCLCSHPALIQENGSHWLDADEANDPEEYRAELSRARAIMPKEFVTKMKEKFKDRALSRMQAEKESQEATAEVDDCPICFDALTSPVVTGCGHEFCRECLDDVFKTPAPEQADGRYKADERPCPACRSAITSEKLFSSAAFEPTDKDLAGESDDAGSDIEMLDAKPAKPTSKGKGKKEKAKRPARKAAKKIVLDSSDVEASDIASEDDYKDSDLSDFIVESDEDEEEKDARREMKRIGKRRAITIIDSDDEMEEAPEEKEVLFGRRPRLSKAEVKLMPRFLPSTKMKAMIDMILKLAKERPDEKTLVISQWTACLNIVSDYLTEKNIIHVKYQGDMTNTKRDQAVQHFMSKDKATVMLMSLKCGGVGLNLTRANNVISLDLGWSPAVDQQAFDRVHRLGQHRKVIVNRLVIANTVEDRILALQQRKQDLADGSLGEGKGKKIAKMNVRELAALFNLDSRGRVLTH